LYSRGGEPIIKNIRVTDEQGNTYEATYPRRAKGLVKQGRARFIDENKICLACPPNHFNLEDQPMNQDKIPKLTMEALLEKIDQITSNTGYLSEAIETMRHIDVFRARTLVKLVAMREETNQCLIALYGQMYNDIAAKNN
jgi:hypothetical protein